MRWFGIFVVMFVIVVLSEEVLFLFDEFFRFGVMVLEDMEVERLGFVMNLLFFINECNFEFELNIL